MEAITVLGLCNGSLIGLVRFSGQTAWERHPAGDEFLHILAGKTHITVLAEGGPMRFTAEAGSAVVVPRGLWHSQCPDSEVTTMFITPAAGSERSMKKDPRVAG
ncbi:hypothetical protein AUC70_05780 [Methyloceanibacter stevinii]|uniref:Cupin type-2 domain-containing protein n=2 Tax=Methyloceanibacter stevinii TaxID=1774970 RepID=A0A1E3VNT7_9HYPH|nr:hypothetical protein AUC70_05780 [Methyloceanibacter stevinii]